MLLRESREQLSTETNSTPEFCNSAVEDSAVHFIFDACVRHPIFSSIFDK